MEAKEGIDISILIVVATLGILVLVFFIIFLVLWNQKRFLANRNQVIALEKQHQEDLLKAAVEIAEYERQKTATNIHDEIGLILNTTKLNMQLIQRKLDKPEVVSQIASQSIESINSSIEVVRTISRDMAPMTLKKMGLISAISEVCKLLSQTGELETQFNYDQAVLEISPDKELQLYRLLKEIINNTVKHGAPTSLVISLQQKNKQLHINLQHNGKGIDSQTVKELAAVSSGLGLKSILTRSELIKANVQFIVPETGNSYVEIKMPL